MEEMKNELKAIENGLVPVYATSTGEKVVYGTELHKALGAPSVYREWSKRRLNDVDAVENEDFEGVEISTPSRQIQKEHIIKLDTAKEMAMLERNEKGKQIRRYFIQLEKKYKTFQKAMVSQAEFDKLCDAMKEYMIHQSERDDKQNETIQFTVRAVGQMMDIFTRISTEVESLKSQNKDPVTDQNPAEHPHRPVYIREKSMRDEEILCYRRKRLNSLVNKVSRLNGWKRNIILHHLYKRLEDELEVSLDSYMDVYQAETGRFDFTTMEVVIAYDFLCKNAILLLSKMTKDLSCEEDELE